MDPGRSLPSHHLQPWGIYRRLSRAGALDFHSSGLVPLVHHVLPLLTSMGLTQVEKLYSVDW